MKEFGDFFKRRYSAVNSDDEQQQHFADVPSAGHITPNAAALLQHATWVEKQRRKSLNPNRSMNPAGILSSFFYESQNNQRGRLPKRAFLILAIGVLAIATAVLVKIFHPYDAIFNWKLNMDGGGEMFNLWEKPPVDLYIKIYLFNITNAEAFLAGKEPMNVEQVGPYVYKELMTHENVTFNANHTMSTNPSHPLIWQEDMSEGHKEDDEVVMLNIAMLAIAHLAANKPYLLRMALNTLFVTSNSQPIVRMTAKEFMFGYSTSLTTLGNTFLPNWISFEKVGLIDRMYDFNTDYETFFTGNPVPAHAGLYATYRGSPNLPQWDGEHCSNIELASDGTKFKSFLQPNETIKFFRKSMCRPVQLHREGEPQKYGSLTGYKYVFEENAFDNGAINEANKCYCRNGKCQPVGLIDVTDCYYGFPISLSYPHFMHGDPGLQSNITGLTPSKELHSSSFVIQPQSGLPLSLSAKIQINMHFDNMKTFNKVARFSHLTVPMLWFDITMPKLSDSLDFRFNFYLNMLPYLDMLGFWGGLALGVSLLVFAVTRATMRMNVTNGAPNISDGKYSKANLLRAAGGSVYNPCEMKLMHENEKQKAQELKTIKEIILARQEANATNDDEDPIQKAANMLYQEVERRQSAFALELEPALSPSESSDEGNDSDTLTGSLSRNSTVSSAMDAHSESSYNKRQQAKRHRNNTQDKESYGSSGLASSIADSREDNQCLLDDSNDETDYDRRSNRSVASTSAAAASSTSSSAAASAPTSMHNKTGRIFEV